MLRRSLSRLPHEFRGRSRRLGRSSLYDGLVVFAPLDEASGVRRDIASNLHLTDNNTVTSASNGGFTWADFELDNSESLSRAHSGHLAQTTALSVAVWLRPETVTDALILGKNSGDAWCVYSESTGRVDAGTNDAVGISDVNVLVQGQASHIAVVYDGSLTGNENRLKVYKNAALLTLDGGFTGTIPASLTNASGSLTLGGTAGLHYDGLMRDFGLWNRPLTAAEVVELHSRPFPW